jgi:hypothetical protein
MKPRYFQRNSVWLADRCLRLQSITNSGISLSELSSPSLICKEQPLRSLPARRSHGSMIRHAVFQSRVGSPAVFPTSKTFHSFSTSSKVAFKSAQCLRSGPETSAARGQVLRISTSLNNARSTNCGYLFTPHAKSEGFERAVPKDCSGFGQSTVSRK